jgi:hypothetical protein
MSNNPAQRDIESIDAEMKSLEFKYYGESRESLKRLSQASFEDRAQMMSAVPERDFVKWWALAETREAILPR